MKQKHPAPDFEQGHKPTAKSSLLSAILRAPFRVQSALLALVAIALYANTLNHEAAFDDRMAITGNEYVQQGVAGIPAILTTDAYQSYLEQHGAGNQLAGGRYRPLSLISFAAEQEVLGTDHEGETDKEQEIRTAADMHLRHYVQVALYALCLVVLLYLLRYVLLPGRPEVAFLAVLIFAVHPIHTEVVANVKSRDELLSLLFIALTFITYARYQDDRKLWHLALALTSYFAALLSKEYAATLLLLVPVWVYVSGRASVRQSFLSVLPFLIPLAMYAALRLNAVHGAESGASANLLNNPYLLATAGQGIATKTVVLLQYLRLLVFPDVLSADYSYRQIPYTGFGNPAVWLAILLYGAMAAGLVVGLVRRHILAFAGAFYLCNLALVSNFFFDIGAPMGERLVFHSSLGFCLCAGWLLWEGMQRIPNRKLADTFLGVVLGTILVLGGYRVIVRNADWKNDDTLFLADVRHAPHSALVNNNAAAACMHIAQQHKTDLDLRNEWLARATVYFDTAIALYPGYWMAYLNRGLCYFNAAQPGKALDDWDTVRLHKPAQINLDKYLGIAARYYGRLGAGLERAGKPDSAIWAYRRAVEAAPGQSAYQKLLDNALQLQQSLHESGYPWLLKK